MAQPPGTPRQTAAADEPVSPLMMATTATEARGPVSPVRFAATTNAFGLTVSPLSSLSSRQTSYASIAHSPPSAGAVATRRLRRPSMLSLAQTPTELTAIYDTPQAGPSNHADALKDQHAQAHDHPPSPFEAPTPRWGTFPDQMRRVSSAPPLPIEALSTSTPPIRDSEQMDTDETARSPLKWLPGHLQPRGPRGKRDSDGAPTPGRPLPGALLATLISESAPLEHEMRSEARLQRLIASHPSALPFTPRQRRSTRGRFPETFEDDDEDAPRRRLGHRWRGSSSSDTSDDDDDWAHGGGAVNSEFASAMDMDQRPVSSSSSVYPANRSDSGKSTPGQSRSLSGSGPDAATPANPTPPSNSAPWPKSTRMSLGMMPSPGMQLPTAFGSLAMGGVGTPLASPTIEKLELATSPGMSMSPGMMQYRDMREMRPGKRKDDRFDPYKRPRGSSPSPFPAHSPSRPTVPIPSSPGVNASYPGLSYFRQPKQYSRPTARSRAASPALSIGSTSGVLSTSLGSVSALAGGKPLGGAFIPTGPGASAAVSAAAAAGAAPGGLGSLGLLSLARDGKERRESDPESIVMIREDSNESSRMEED